jgi:hypothetical protein
MSSTDHIDGVLNTSYIKYLFIFIFIYIYIFFFFFFFFFFWGTCELLPVEKERCEVMWTDSFVLIMEDD